MLVKAVAAKIALLEKEKTQEGVLLEGAGVVAPNQVTPAVCRTFPKLTYRIKHGEWNLDLVVAALGKAK